MCVKRLTSFFTTRARMANSSAPSGHFSAPTFQPSLCFPTPTLLNLPNDLLMLILEYFSPIDLFHFYKFVELDSLRHSSSSTPLTSSSQTVIRNLVQIFNHNSGFLFHRFALDPPTLQWLRKISVRVTKLRFKNYDEKSLQYVRLYKQSIQEMDFHLSPELNMTSFNQLGSCPSLTSVSLENCSKIHYLSLERFLKSNPRLESLNLRAARLFTSKVLPVLTACGRNLRYLNMSEQHWFDDNCFRSITKSLPRLKSINISETSVRMKSVVEFLKTKPSVQSIGYSGARTDLEQEDITFLMQFALQGVMSDDLVSLHLGLDNLNKFLGVYHGTILRMIRSTGAMSQILRSVDHQVSIIP
jgi:hypothetical protein